MKNLYLILILLFCGNMTNAQNSLITGAFKSGFDNSGNQFVYFQGTNQTQYNLNIAVKCVNEQLEEQNNWEFTLLTDNSFVIGPNEGWSWMPGEKLYITFQNGKSVYWVYNPASNGYDTNTIIQNNRATTNKYRIEQIKLQISQLERKINDENRSLQFHKESGDKNVTITNQMLQQSIQRLIQTYETQKSNLEMELIRLQN